MKHPLFLALASACTLAAAATATSCKSNDIAANTNNSTETFESETTQMVGPMGFDVVGPDHSEAIIPANALASSVNIVIGTLSAGFPALPSGWSVPGAVFTFEPHGTTFALPVTLKVPYVDPGTPIRLVTAQPGGTWTPVDHIPLANGFATTPVNHFSYFAVVTGDGAEPPPLPEGGADAETDAGETDATTSDVAVIDSSTPPEAAAPPQPTLFGVSSANGTAYRFQITPSVIVQPDAGSDAGPTVVYGNLTPDVVYQAPDGGPVPGALAMGNSEGGAPYTLYLGAINEADRASSGVLPVSDPFGTPTPGVSFAANNPIGMAYGNELWLSSGTNASHVVTVDGTGNVNWGASGPISNDGPFDFLTVDTVHQILYANIGAVQAWPYTGQGASKDAGPSSFVNGSWENPETMAIAPWGDLLVLDSMNFVWDVGGDSGAPPDFSLPFVGTPACMAIVHWASSGVDEIFVALQSPGGLYRVVLDQNHVEVGTSMVQQSGVVFDQLLVAP